MKHFIDKIFRVAISKKLFVFLIGTFLAYNSLISGEQWVNLAIIYIGTQGVIDAIIKIRNNK